MSEYTYSQDVSAYDESYQLLAMERLYQFHASFDVTMDPQCVYHVAQQILEVCSFFGMAQIPVHFFMRQHLTLGLVVDPQETDDDINETIRISILELANFSLMYGKNVLSADHEAQKIVRRFMSLEKKQKWSFTIVAALFNEVASTQEIDEMHILLIRHTINYLCWFDMDMQTYTLVGYLVSRVGEYLAKRYATEKKYTAVEIVYLFLLYSPNDKKALWPVDKQLDDVEALGLIQTVTFQTLVSMKEYYKYQDMHDEAKALNRQAQVMFNTLFPPSENEHVQECHKRIADCLDDDDATAGDSDAGSEGALTEDETRRVKRQKCV